MLKSLGIMLFWLTASVVFAQSTDGAWQRLQNGAVSVRVPQAWIPVPDVGGSGGAYAADTTGISFGGTLMAAGKTLADVVNDPAGIFSSATVKQPVSLPAGEAYRIESTQQLNGQSYRTLTYVLAVDTVMITLQGRQPVDSGDAFPLFDRIANTLVIDDARAAGWTRYSDVSGKISLQTPPDWLQKSAGDKVLTVIQPEKNQVLTLNYRTLSQPVILEEAVQSLLAAYDTQNIAVAALEPISLPAGEAYRALLMNVPAQTSSASIQTQQYQYLFLRGSTLILVNGGCESSQFESCRPLIEQMVDTIVFDAS